MRTVTQSHLVGLQLRCLFGFCLSLSSSLAVAYKLHIRGAEISDAKMLSAMLAHEMSGGGGGGYDAAGEDAGGDD